MIRSLAELGMGVRCLTAKPKYLLLDTSLVYFLLGETDLSAGTAEKAHCLPCQCAGDGGTRPVQIARHTQRRPFGTLGNGTF